MEQLQAFDGGPCGTSALTDVLGCNDYSQADKDMVQHLAQAMGVAGVWREPDNYCWAGITTGREPPPWNPLEYVSTVVEMAMRLGTPFPAAGECKNANEFCRRVSTLALETLPPNAGVTGA